MVCAVREMLGRLSCPGEWKASFATGPIAEVHVGAVIHM